MPSPQAAPTASGAFASRYQRIKTRLAGPTMATWVSFATRAASFVVLYPFVLRGYDQTDILFWLSVSLPGSMLALVDAGMMPTAVRFFAYGVAASEEPSKAKWDLGAVIGTVRTVYRVLTLAALVISIGLATWVMRNQPQLPTYWIGWGITVLSVTAYFYSFPHQAWLQATQRIPELRFREAKFQLSAMCVSAVLAMIHVDILAIVLVNAASLFALAVLHIRSTRLGPTGHFWFARTRYDRTVAKDLYDSSWKSGVGVAASYGLNQGICAWYAGAASPGIAAQFLLTMRLLQVASQVSQAPFYTKIPTLVTLYSKNQLQAVVDTAQTGTARAMWTYVVLALGVSIVAPELLRLLGSKTTLMPASWLLIAVMAIGFERCGAMLVQTYTITNIVHWHWLNSAVAMLAVLIAFLIWPFFADISVPISWGACMLTLYVPVGYYLTYQLLGRRNVNELLKKALLPTVALAAIYLALHFIKIRLIP